MDTRLGFIGIIIENREKSAERINAILAEYGSIIIARTGIPYKDKDCCVITLVVNATTDEVGALTGRLGNIEGISVKSALSRK